jgi:hypothetical protein
MTWSAAFLGRSHVQQADGLKFSEIIGRKFMAASGNGRATATSGCRCSERTLENYASIPVHPASRRDSPLRVV